MNASKIYFIQNEKSVLGYADSPRSVVFGFRNKRHVEQVKQHVRYIPSNDEIEAVSSNRYLIRTHYNAENNIAAVNPRELQVTSKNLYDAAVTCGLNNLSLSIVDHIYDRDDGDIEISCIRVKDMLAKVPVVDREIVKYNLELLYINF